MTTVIGELYKKRGSIKCSACGNCCQGITSPCKRLRPDGLCEIHPARVGVDRRENLEPDCVPDTDPVEVMLDIGYFCPDVARAIGELTGIYLEPTEVWNSRFLGPISRESMRRGLDNGNAKKVFADVQALNAVLEMEI